MPQLRRWKVTGPLWEQRGPDRGQLGDVLAGLCDTPFSSLEPVCRYAEACSIDHATFGVMAVL